mmetsp:Transcript_21812/g.60716  ORF Transcript_21812/g.60716 Transcript_21812/m.60716 type:complete len:129 (-) Transcript_21812:121-507(-)
MRCEYSFKAEIRSWVQQQQQQQSQPLAYRRAPAVSVFCPIKSCRIPSREFGSCLPQLSESVEFNAEASDVVTTIPSSCWPPHSSGRPSLIARQAILIRSSAIVTASIDQHQHPSYLENLLGSGGMDAP